MAKKTNSDKPDMFGAALRIVATTAGFWRGGRQHPAAEVTHPPGTFTHEQARQIKDEAELADGAGVKIGKLIVRELTDAEHDAHLAAAEPAPKGKTET